MIINVFYSWWWWSPWSWLSSPSLSSSEGNPRLDICKILSNVAMHFTFFNNYRSSHLDHVFLIQRPLNKQQGPIYRYISWHHVTCDASHRFMWGSGSRNLGRGDSQQLDLPSALWQIMRSAIIATGSTLDDIYIYIQSIYSRMFSMKKAVSKHEDTQSANKSGESIWSNSIWPDYQLNLFWNGLNIFGCLR